MTIDFEKLKIKIRRPKKLDRKLHAVISVDFGDFIVNGFRIMDSNQENEYGHMLWLTPPSYLAAGKYHKIFFVKEENVRDELYDKIWDEFYKKFTIQEPENNESSDLDSF